MVSSCDSFQFIRWLFWNGKSNPLTLQVCGVVDACVHNCYSSFLECTNKSLPISLCSVDTERLGEDTCLVPAYKLFFLSSRCKFLYLLHFPTLPLLKDAHSVVRFGTGKSRPLQALLGMLWKQKAMAFRCFTMQETANSNSGQPLLFSRIADMQLWACANLALGILISRYLGPQSKSAFMCV